MKTKWIYMLSSVCACALLNNVLIVSGHPFGMEQNGVSEEPAFAGRMNDDFGDFHFESGRSGEEESGVAGPPGPSDSSAMFESNDDSFESHATSGGSSAGRNEQSSGMPPAEADLGGSELNDGEDSESPAGPPHRGRPGRRERGMMRSPHDDPNGDDNASSGPEGNAHHHAHQQPRSFDFEMDPTFDHDGPPSKPHRSRQSGQYSAEGPMGGAGGEDGSSSGQPGADDSSSQSGRFSIDDDDHSSNAQHHSVGQQSLHESDPSNSNEATSGLSSPLSSSSSSSSAFGTSGADNQRARLRSGRTPPPQAYHQRSTSRASKRGYRLHPQHPQHSPASSSERSNPMSSISSMIDNQSPSVTPPSYSSLSASQRSNSGSMIDTSVDSIPQTISESTSVRHQPMERQLDHSSSYSFRPEISKSRRSRYHGKHKSRSSHMLSMSSPSSEPTSPAHLSHSPSSSSSSSSSLSSPPLSSSSLSSSSGSQSGPHSGSVDETELRLLQDFERSIESSRSGIDSSIDSAFHANQEDLSPSNAPTFGGSFGPEDAISARSLSRPEVPNNSKYEHESVEGAPTYGRSMANGASINLDQTAPQFIPVNLHGQPIIPNPLTSVPYSPSYPSSADSNSAATSSLASPSVAASVPEAEDQGSANHDGSVESELDLLSPKVGSNGQAYRGGSDQDEGEALDPQMQEYMNKWIEKFEKDPSLIESLSKSVQNINYGYNRR